MSGLPGPELSRIIKGDTHYIVEIKIKPPGRKTAVVSYRTAADEFELVALVREVYAGA